MNMKLKTWALFLPTVLSTLPLVAAHAATAQQESAGRLPDGSEVAAITLKAKNGVSARILTYGAALQVLMAPDRYGRLADIVLGYDDLNSYVEHPSYFGSIIGRYSNRIANGRFTLEHRSYQLPTNDHTNSLHGGISGFDRVPWDLVSMQSGRTASVTLRHISPDGDAGYPGRLTSFVTYSLDNSGNLTIVMEANSDKPTVVSLTNHSFFNLRGEGSGDATDAFLTVPAQAFTPVDSKLIPTGELRPVDGTDFDFRTRRQLSKALRNGQDEQLVYGRGYDHNFALDKGVTETPKLAAILEDPHSGRVLKVLSTEPGIQVYSGNYLDGSLIGKHGHLYRMGDAIALEPQKYPDSPNHSNFPSALVTPEKPYRHTIVFQLSVQH